MQINLVSNTLRNIGLYWSNESTHNKQQPVKQQSVYYAHPSPSRFPSHVLTMQIRKPLGYSIDYDWIKLFTCCGGVLRKCDWLLKPGISGGTCCWLVACFWLSSIEKKNHNIFVSIPYQVSPSKLFFNHAMYLATFLISTCNTHLK